MLFELCALMQSLALNNYFILHSHLIIEWFCFSALLTLMSKPVSSPSCFLFLKLILILKGACVNSTITGHRES